MVRNPISMILPLLLLALTYIMTYFTLVDHPKRLWISSLFYFAWALCVLLFGGLPQSIIPFFILGGFTQYGPPPHDCQKSLKIFF